jgi:hypothetical protein
MAGKAFIRAVLALLSVVAAGAETAASAEASPKQAPEVAYSLPWAVIAYLVVSTVAICAVAFKNAKRTHLD